ncbi:MAG TPA: TIGR03086 family metal-binding protein [Actinophytocola sp.]|jgi:uncharacterized protein (TIGR03086 family)|uniref:TIGR03086 family metal-binding protein n=1 Tax=Actinophytocola sp. TaxID=1872138 RepID=UPI002E0C44A6|nr:TIGR03086 family metal-binding protein [Actinophytocola sp.]
MELLEAHGRAMAGFDRVVGRIADTDWSAPTPCSEWTVRDLLNHLVYEQLWVPELLGGATVEEVGDRFDGDVLDGDPVGRWRAASAAARSAWLAPGAVDREVSLSSRRAPAATYGWEMTLDLGVHGWDLAVGVGAESPLDAGLADTLLDVFEDIVPTWQGFGIFAPPLPVSAGADSPTRLLALCGRTR